MQENTYIFRVRHTLLRICPFLLMGLVLGLLPGCSGKSEPATDDPERVGQEIIVAKLPKVGEIVTTEKALALCRHYGFDYLTERIGDHPDSFKEWEFDGCSMTTDEFLGDLIKVSSLTEICLRHDLGYAYGDPGNREERLEVDWKFHDDLIRAGAGEFSAKAMFNAVRVGGKEELCLPFSWGFARVAPCKPGFGWKSKK